MVSKKLQGIEATPINLKILIPWQNLPLPERKEEKQYGEYRTCRLVLVAWDAIEKGNL